MNNAIRSFRTEADMSQADLAAKVGVTRQTINAIERERYDPSVELAFKLANWFGCQIEELFDPEIEDDSSVEGSTNA
jgi:putative transcriptional regulator